MKPRFQDVEAVVLRVISGDTSFSEGLSAVIAYQRAWNPTLAAWWEQRGYVDGPDVPGVPTDVFQHVTLCSSEHPITHTFRTSGTTGSSRGAHHRFALTCYDTGALQQFRQLLNLSSPRPFLPLVFSSKDVPDSSLSHMVDLFIDEVAQPPVIYPLTPDRLDVDRAREWLATLRSPAILFGTAWAFVLLLDALPEPIVLPPGTVTFETGGYKGRSRELDPDRFRAALTGGLGIPLSHQYSEYSMTELSSQLYRQGDAPYQTPPWCIVDAVDPITLSPLPMGTPGLLRFIDLCNIETVVSVQTSDIGIVTPTGIALQGRAPDATPRGCSLAVEEVCALLSS